MTEPTSPAMTTLNDLDSSISEKIRQLAIKLHARFNIALRVAASPDEDLVFGKHGGEWMFYLETDHHVTPLLSCSRERRLEAVPQIQKLIAEAEGQVAAQIPERIAALRELETMLQAEEQL